MDVTTDEAAARLGVSRRRVIEMLRDGELVGRRVHRTWIVEISSVQDRMLTRTAGGRRLSPETARRIVDQLSFGRSAGGRIRTDAVKRTTPELAAVLAQTIVIRRFATRRPERAAEYLHLTGESAVHLLTDGVGEELVGSSRVIHGYRRDITWEELIDDAMLVADDSGVVAVHGFRDDVFPWDDTPRALVAVDAARSSHSRVREAGLRALDEMRKRWLDSTM